MKMLKVVIMRRISREFSKVGKLSTWSSSFHFSRSFSLSNLHFSYIFSELLFKWAGMSVVAPPLPLFLF